MINIGKAIASILNNNATIQTLVNDNIYPLIFPENTPNDAICYERQSTLDYTKDGRGIANNTIIITVRASTYAKSVEIAEAVFMALYNYTGTVLGNNIIDVTMSGIDENIIDNKYFQQLNFNIQST